MSPRLSVAREPCILAESNGRTRPRSDRFPVIGSTNDSSTGLPGPTETSPQSCVCSLRADPGLDPTDLADRHGLRPAVGHQPIPPRLLPNRHARRPRGVGLAGRTPVGMVDDRGTLRRHGCHAGAMDHATIKQDFRSAPFKPFTRKTIGRPSVEGVFRTRIRLPASDIRWTMRGVPGRVSFASVPRTTVQYSRTRQSGCALAGASASSIAATMSAPASWIRFPTAAKDSGRRPPG